MGVVKTPDGYTPICNICGIFHWWNVTEKEYAEQRVYWGYWKCKDCRENRRETCR